MSDLPVQLTEPLFYRAVLNNEGDIALGGDEARHVAAQRLRAGDAIALFDGCGHLARGRIRALNRREVLVQVEQHRHEPPPVPQLELYSAVPKGDRVAVLLDMATQLGITRFVPLRWRHSVADPGERAPERWRRICIEACKQSRRLHVPEIAATAPAADAAVRARASPRCLLVAHPDGETVPVATVDLRSAERIALFVGPEGGLTDDEVEMLRRLGARFVRLNDAVLRIETAAVALICAAIGGICADHTTADFAGSATKR